MGEGTTLYAARFTERRRCGVADFEAVWALERRMWLAGRRFYEVAVADDAVFSLPPPLGIFSGKDFVRHMGEGGLCQSVELDNRHARALADHVLLVYRGEGISHDGTQRFANCLSVYRPHGDQWLLCAHQQTPLDGDPD